MEEKRAHYLTNGRSWVSKFNQQTQKWESCDEATRQYYLGAITKHDHPPLIWRSMYVAEFSVREPID